MPGNYTENIVINKPLTLKGYGQRKPIIYSNNKYIIKVISRRVTIDGFNITGAHGGDSRDNSCAIYAYGNITELRLYRNDILADMRFGIRLWNVDYFDISKNNLSGFTDGNDSSIGIYLIDCDGGAICSNNITCKNNDNTCGVLRKRSPINCGNGIALENCNQIDCEDPVKDRQ